MIASLATTRSDVELLTLDLAGFDRVLGECRQARCGGAEKDQVPVLIVRDRSGATADFMLDAIDKKAIEPPLRTVLKKDVIFCSDGAAVYRSVARRLGITHHPVNTTKQVMSSNPAQALHELHYSEYGCPCQNTSKSVETITCQCLPQPS